MAKNVSTLVKQLKSAEGAEKESVAQKLKSAVGEQFDFRHDAKAKELRALEEQLAKLKEIHNKRTQQRDRIVADRVQQILSEVDSLGWGVADASESLDMGPGSGGGMSGMDWTGRTRVLGTRNGFLAPAIAPTATIPAGGMSGPDPATRSPNSVVPPAGRR